MTPSDDEADTERRTDEARPESESAPAPPQKREVAPQPKRPPPGRPGTPDRPTPPGRR